MRASRLPPVAACSHAVASIGQALVCVMQKLQNLHVATPYLQPQLLQRCSNLNIYRCCAFDFEQLPESWLPSMAAVEGVVLRLQRPAIAVAGLSACLLVVPAYTCKMLLMPTLR